MECQFGLPQICGMATTAEIKIFDINEPLGKKACGREPVSLLCEALRLNCSETEIAELRRLYSGCDGVPAVKTPQKAG